jgi:hypothetical protein
MVDAGSRRLSSGRRDPAHRGEAQCSAARRERNKGCAVMPVNFVPLKREEQTGSLQGEYNTQIVQAWRLV